MGFARKLGSMGSDALSKIKGKSGANKAATSPIDESLYYEIIEIISGVDNGDVFVHGIITSPFTVDGSNTFTEPFEDTKIVKQVMTALAIGSTALNAAGKNTGGQTAVLSRTQTNKFWTGSKIPNFSVDLAFITTNSANANEDVTKMVSDIMRCLYPTASGKGIKEVLHAPLGYAPFGGGDGKSIESLRVAKGTVSLKIGKWFYANNLVVTGASFTFSKEVTATGKPLFATGSVSLEPYRAITYDEFDKYFTTRPVYTKR